MVTYYFKTVQDEKLNVIDKPRNGVWAHAESPTEEEIEQLVKDFGVDETILADAQDFFEVPRFERSGNAAYFFTRYPFDDDTEDIDTAPLLIVMGESFVLTIALREVPFLEKIIHAGRDVSTTQKTKLFIQMMSHLTAMYERKLVRIRKSVHKNRINLQKISARDIQRLVTYEHTLNDILAAVIPTNDWLNEVLDGNYLQLFIEDVELMEGLRIANAQLIGSSRSVLKTIQNVRGASEAILTSSLNTIMRVLTALTIILTVPTIVASLYGMNVALPLADHPHMFWLLVVLVVAMISLMVFYFIRNRWL